jgi:hypothetical protein
MSSGNRGTVVKNHCLRFPAGSEAALSLKPDEFIARTGASHGSRYQLRFFSTLRLSKKAIRVLVDTGSGRRFQMEQWKEVWREGLSLPVRALPRIGQKEEPGGVCSDAGGRRGLELSRCLNNPEHDCRYEAHGK